MALGVVEETKSEKEIPQEIKPVLDEAAEALSRKHALLTSIQVKVVELEMVKDPKVIVNGIKKLHEGLKTEKKYAKYVEQTIMHGKLVEFEIGGLVWVHLNNDRFLAWKFGRLKSMVDCPSKVNEKIEENTYKLELPDDYDISHTFNVKDLRPYHGKDLRASLFSQLWGIDAGTSSTNIGNCPFIIEDSDLEGCKALGSSK